MWRFYLHCGMEENGSPGIISIVCHQVLHHPSEHGISSMGKHLLRKANIAKLNKLIESEVAGLTSSSVDETALAILTWQGCRGFRIGSSLSQIILDIQIVPYWPEWQTKCSKLEAEDFETSEFHQDTYNRYRMLGFVSVHIPRKSIPNHELQWLFEALRDNLVLTSTTTLCLICQGEYALTVDAIKRMCCYEIKLV